MEKPSAKLRESLSWSSESQIKVLVLHKDKIGVKKIKSLDKVLYKDASYFAKNTMFLLPNLH